MKVAGNNARGAYDLAAADYDGWSWQAFWRCHEAPTVLAWLTSAPGRRLLDVGSGTGFYMAQLSCRGFFCTGLDVSASMLALSAQRLGTAALHVQGEAALLPFADASFDQLLMTRAMSHVGDPAAVFREARRVMGRHGRFVLTDIDPAHDYERTELPFGNQRIAVTTYKRSLEELAGAAAAEGFVLSASMAIDEDGHLHDRCATARPAAFLAAFKS